MQNEFGHHSFYVNVYSYSIKNQKYTSSLSPEGVFILLDCFGGSRQVLRIPAVEKSAFSQK